MSTITPTILEGLKELREKGNVTFLYSGDLSTEAQDAATAAIEAAIRQTYSLLHAAKCATED